MKLGILLGDDIGPEVVPECVKVIKAAAERTGLDIDWRELPIGKRGHEEHGDTLPKVTEKALWELDGWIMGPIGHNAYPRNDPTWVMPPVRKTYDLFASVRPSRSYANVASVHKDVDIVAMAQATHGSAPDIAGRGLANPYAMIMSGQMLLGWLGRKHGEPKAAAAAERIQGAVEQVIADARHLTRDLGGQASTREMGDAIAEAAAQ